MKTPTTNRLQGTTIALLVTDGFEQVEFTSPREALAEAGAKTQLVSPKDQEVRGWQHTKWGDTFPVDVPLTEANADGYDALVLPGGVMNPDHLRRNEQVQTFVRAFFDAGKPVAAICHGAWTLIDAGVVEGRTVTSYPSIQMDLKNAGAIWVDREVVVDGTLITSRRPDDLPAFNKALIDAVEEAHAEAEPA